MLIARLEALKAKIPKKEQPLEVRRAFGDRLRQTLLTGFNLSPDLINLSREEAREEAEALDDYFYANYLIVQCKQAAVRVSPKTWAAIEARMLLAPSD